MVARSRQQPIFIPLCCLSQGHGDSRKRPVPYPRYGGDPCLIPPPFKEEGWGEGNIHPLPFAGEGWGEGESPCSAMCLASGFRPNYRLRKYHRERESTKIPAPSAPSAVNCPPAFDRHEHIIYHSPTVHNTPYHAARARPSENERVCHKMSGNVRLNKTPHYLRALYGERASPTQYSLLSTPTSQNVSKCQDKHDPPPLSLRPLP